MELLFFKRIYNLIINELPITKKNLKKVLEVPKASKYNTINEIDRQIKDLIDDLTIKFGFNATLVKLSEIELNLQKLGVNCSIGTNELFVIALKNFYKRIMTYYEGIVYPIIVKYLIKLKFGKFSKDELLDDLKRNAKSEILLLGVNDMHQIILNSFVNVNPNLDDLKISCSIRASIKKKALKTVNQILDKKDIFECSRLLIDTLSSDLTPEVNVFTNCAVRVLEDMYEYNEYKPKEKNDTRQLKLKGF